MGKAFIHRSSKSDVYETPYSMTRDLLEWDIFESGGSFLEPARGNGAISKILKENFEDVTEYDIESDFLKETRKYDYVITNPPYSLADEFVIKGRQVMNKGMALLLRTNYLSGQKRFRAVVFKELLSVLIYTRMADLRAPIREDGKYPTAGIVYAWFIWEKDFNGSPRIDWIDNGEMVLRKKEL